MKRERTIGYDFIRIIAILMVVVIHCNVNFLSENRGSAQWVFVMELTVLCLMSVPLFFMVSGALLLDCKQVISIKENLLWRIPKQAVPFVIWSCIYVTVRILLGKIDFSAKAYLSLLYEPAWYQFWFMYTLLAIYLLLPFIQLLILNASKKQLEYLLMIWFAFSVLIPYLENFIPGFKISEHVDLILCEGFLGYFILGYYLRRYQKKLKNQYVHYY